MLGTICGCTEGPEVFFGICFASGIFLLVLAINILLVVWPFCRIFAKAGYPWAMGILMMVPIANVIMPFVLAFGDWPVLRTPNRPSRQTDNHSVDTQPSAEPSGPAGTL